ncbi:MAG: hypothetical protein ACQERB_07730 [Promethearchaeati archaeon]
MVNLEKVRDWAWKISLIAIILNIVALLIPNIFYIVFGGRNAIFWLYNFYITEYGFSFLPFAAINPIFKIYFILGYIIAIVVIICIVLTLIAMLKEKGANLGKLYLLWIVSGILLIIIGIIAWAVRGAILFLDEIGFPIPLGSLLILVSGIFTLTIGIVSMKVPR